MSQVDNIVKFLFGFQSPEGRALPEIPWDIFKVDKDRRDKRKWGGLCRGEALAGLHPDPKIFVWNEIAHLDLYLGLSTGPAGFGYATALATQGHGYNNLMAVANPNLAVNPSVAMVTKVGTPTLARANQMFGAAQSAIADATIGALEHGFFPDEIVDDLVCVCGVFIHPYAGVKFENGKPVKDDDKQLVMLGGEEAADSNHRIYCLNSAKKTRPIRSSLLSLCFYLVLELFGF